MTEPRYQDVEAKDVPEVVDDDGTCVRIIVGQFWGKTGPVDGVAADPRYLDVSVPPGTSRTLPVDRVHHAFAYVFEGSGSFRDASEPQAVVTERVADAGDEAIDRVGNRTLVLFDRGDEVAVQAGDEGVRFLLVSGRPLKEPVAWQGPIVMNTRECIAPGFLDSDLKVIISTQPRPGRRSRVALEPGCDSRTSPASTARCTSA